MKVLQGSFFLYLFLLVYLPSIFWLNSCRQETGNDAELQRSLSESEFGTATQVIRDSEKYLTVKYLADGCFARSLFLAAELARAGIAANQVAVESCDKKKLKTIGIGLSGQNLHKRNIELFAEEISGAPNQCGVRKVYPENDITMKSAGVRFTINTLQDACYKLGKYFSDERHWHQWTPVTDGEVSRKQDLMATRFAQTSRALWKIGMVSG